MSMKPVVPSIGGDPLSMEQAETERALEGSSAKEAAAERAMEGSSAKKAAAERAMEGPSAREGSAEPAPRRNIGETSNSKMVNRIMRNTFSKHRKFPKIFYENHLVSNLNSRRLFQLNLLATKNYQSTITMHDF